MGKKLLQAETMAMEKDDKIRGFEKKIKNQENELVSQS